MRAAESVEAGSEQKKGTVDAAGEAGKARRAAASWGLAADAMTSGAGQRQGLPGCPGCRR